MAEKYANSINILQRNKNKNINGKHTKTQTHTQHLEDHLIFVSRYKLKTEMKKTEQEKIESFCNHFGVCCSREMFLFFKYI